MRLLSAGHETTPRQAMPPGRVQLLGIDERTSGVDVVVAQLFTTMRGALALPLPEIARRIGASPDVLAHLEAGRIRALPPAHETVRIVTAYGRLLQIDVRPILARIDQQLTFREPLRRAPVTAPKPADGIAAVRAALPAGEQAAAAAESAAARSAAATPDPAAGAIGRLTQRVNGRRNGAAARAAVVIAGAAADTNAANALAAVPSRRWWRRSHTVVATAVLFGSVTLATVAQSDTPMLYAAVDRLPASLAKGLRDRLDKIVPRASRIGDTLRWIEVADPRQRKADRLDPSRAR